MNGNLFFSAARCVTCTLPKLGALGNGVASAVQQTSTLLRSSLAVSTTGTRSLSSITSPARPSLSQTANNFSLSKSTALASSHVGSASVAPCLLATSTPAVTATRGRASVYYRPSAWKRVNKHGLEKRLRKPSGIEILWRRILKKRHTLSPFDRILPGTYNGQILPDHHLKYNQHLVSKDVRKKMKAAIRKY